MCKKLRRNYQNYQENIRLNIFGERDNYKYFGSISAMIITLFGYLFIFGYLYASM